VSFPPLFIVGGNGSGKTTLLKVIAGLYEPRTGAINVDDVQATRSLQPRYRSLFAGVFGDFHLFDRLYGVRKIDEATADDLLARMGISHKVKIVDGRFSTLDLSTGQRKRLALIASLLEDRLVYIFDEWTADQDPHFREEFYRKILPGLKSHGKTIIAITHDDRYWDQCDRIVKLDYGQIVSMGSNPPPVGSQPATNRVLT
jgi:putative pyoverdin transport system ATP-binding/permease protein